jgi:hypothetical protein
MIELSYGGFSEEEYGPWGIIIIIFLWLYRRWTADIGIALLHQRWTLELYKDGNAFEEERRRVSVRRSFFEEGREKLGRDWTRGSEYAVTALGQPENFITVYTEVAC